MFEVLVFVYENYWHGDACPELVQLERKLNAAGFEAEEVQDALTWLNDLNMATLGFQPLAVGSEAMQSPSRNHLPMLVQSKDSMRVYSVAEQNHLGQQGLGFMTFLESVGALPAHMREIVMDCAMAAPGTGVPLDDLKIIILMVFWSLGIEPDALVLDDLCEDTARRVTH